MSLIAAVCLIFCSDKCGDISSHQLALQQHQVCRQGCNLRGNVNCVMSQIFPRDDVIFYLMIPNGQVSELVISM